MSNINFEENIEKLDNIANDLENGNLSLDESIKKFEEGMKISKELNDYLDEAEKKITMIINEDGKIKEENFVGEEE
jgi:exodeoxyribonuclease VII small subunit